MSGPNINKELIIQGETAAGAGFNFNDFYGFDLTDAWTQLFGIFFLVASYGFFLMYYVTSKKFPKPKRRPKSKAWYAWDKNTVSYIIPYATKHRDFLGWSLDDHCEEFAGRNQFFREFTKTCSFSSRFHLLSTECTFENLDV